MRAVIQRVTSAKVEVEGKVTGEIGKGFLILFGVGQEDTAADCDVGGDILCVSQFTLYADCHHGNRPSFIYAGKPDEANRLYEYFCKVCGEKISGKVEKGVFGADMKVSLLNDGPFTIILECRNGEIIP